MKKFLLLLLLVLFIITPIVTVEAADIPSFSRVAGNYVPFKTKEIWRKKDGCTYYYECSVDLRENFAAQYTKLLKQYRISYLGHEARIFAEQVHNILTNGFSLAGGDVLKFGDTNILTKAE